MLTLDDVFDEVVEAAKTNTVLKRINVTNQAPKGSLYWGFVPGTFEAEIKVHPNDWEGLKDQALRPNPLRPNPLRPNPLTDQLWGLPVFITDQPTPKTNVLSVRCRNKGVEHSIDVFDEGGNKLGEVKGCTVVDFQADARGWGELTVRFRVADGGLDGP